MIIDLVRLKTIGVLTHTSNPTRDLTEICLWSAIELDVGVICPCLPSFRLLLRQLMPNVMGTSDHHHETDPVSNSSGIRRPSAGRKSLSGGLELGTRKIVVENTIASKYGSTRNNSTDGRSCESVIGLVEQRALPEPDESGRAIYMYGKGAP